MINYRNSIQRAALGLTAAASIFLASAPAIAAGENRCEARFDFFPNFGQDISGKVEWRDRRGGQVDVEVESDPALGLAGTAAKAIVRAKNTDGEVARMRCSFDFGDPGEDDICERRRGNQGDLLGRNISLRVKGVGRLTMPCLAG